MIARLKYWYRIGRHVKALRRVNILAIDAQEFNNHDYVVHSFGEWASKSGSLHNGATPNHTKKRVARFAEVLRGFFPQPIDGSAAR